MKEKKHNTDNKKRPKKEERRREFRHHGDGPEMDHVLDQCEVLSGFRLAASLCYVHMESVQRYRSSGTIVVKFDTRLVQYTQVARDDEKMRRTLTSCVGKVKQLSGHISIRPLPLMNQLSTALAHKLLLHSTRAR